jgi:AraC-like DNA-binding protein
VRSVDPARRLLRVRDAIDARYAETLDVGVLAHMAGISRAHFSRLFHEAFGEPPHQYLKTRRLERAAALLRSTDEPVADICRDVGLRSVGSFTTSFGRAYGVSPAAYRASRPLSAQAAAIPPCQLRAWARPRPARA